MFFKIGVIKNLATFLGKHLSWSLFLIKLQLQRRCFPVNIAKCIGIPPVAASEEADFTKDFFICSQNKINTDNLPPILSVFNLWHQIARLLCLALGLFLLNMIVERVGKCKP